MFIKGGVSRPFLSAIVNFTLPFDRTTKGLTNVSLLRAPSNKSLSAKVLVAVVSLVPLMPAFAQDAVTNEIGYQGFSGLFNVPNGAALNYGEFHFSYSTLSDISGRGNYFQGNNVNLSVRPFSGLEVAMRK